MKRLRIIIFSILLCLPITVNAANSLSITCNSTEVKPGDVVTCSIKGFAEQEIGAIEAEITYGNGMTRNSFTTSSGWTGDDTNNRIDLYETTADDLSGNFDLCTFSIKISENATAGETRFELKNIVFYKDAESYNVNSISVTFNVNGNASSDTSPKLESLEVSGGTLSPAVISDDNDTYAIILDSGVDTFSIVATPSNTNYSVTAKNTDTNESIDLSNIKFKTASGKREMSITIIVSADGNNSKSYTIIVTKSTSATAGEPELKTLTIGDVDVKLESGRYDYTVKLDDVTIYMVEATLKDNENYKFDEFISPPVYLHGEREFILKIVPRDSSSNLSSVTYTIVVKGPGATAIPLPSSSQQTPSSQNPGTNPQTGNSSAFFMAIIIVLSLVASFYLYKMNMNKYNSN